MSIIRCPHCSGEYKVELVVSDAVRAPSSAPTGDGYDWYKRGDLTNEEALEKCRKFVATLPVGRRFVAGRLYEEYMCLYDRGPGTFLSMKNFSAALRDLGGISYRTGDARGYVFGGEEVAREAAANSNFRANAARAIEHARTQSAATMEEGGQDSP